MKNQILTGLGILVFLLTSACGSVGKDFDIELTKSIVNGKTTKEDIRSMFGPPFKTGIQNGKELWVYENNQYSALGEDRSKDFSVVFDKDGVVRSHQVMSSEAQR